MYTLIIKAVVNYAQIVLTLPGLELPKEAWRKTKPENKLV